MPEDAMRYVLPFSVRSLGSTRAFSRMNTVELDPWMRQPVRLTGAVGSVAGGAAGECGGAGLVSEEGSGEAAGYCAWACCTVTHAKPTAMPATSARRGRFIVDSFHVREGSNREGRAKK